MGRGYRYLALFSSRDGTTVTKTRLYPDPGLWWEPEQDPTLNQHRAKGLYVTDPDWRFKVLCFRLAVGANRLLAVGATAVRSADWCVEPMLPSVGGLSDGPTQTHQAATNEPAVRREPGRGWRRGCLRPATGNFRRPSPGTPCFWSWILGY